MKGFQREAYITNVASVSFLTTDGSNRSFLSISLIVNGENSTKQESFKINRISVSAWRTKRHNTDEDCEGLFFLTVSFA